MWDFEKKREEDSKKENYCPNKVTCTQKKKGSNDIHEKPVDDEDEDDDENCPKKVTRTCAQKKCSYDIHEKQVDNED